MSKQAEGPGKALKILIVEDETLLLDIYKTKFEMEGFKVFLARDGREGLELAKKERPSLILLDILMPDVDGYTVIRMLRRDKELKAIPILVFSNLGQKTEVAKGLKLGADEYLVKSNYTPQELVQKVKQMLVKGD